MTPLLTLALGMLLPSHAPAPPAPGLPQRAEKLLIASIEPAAVDGGSVAELVWEGDELVVLIAVPQGGGFEPRFYALAGPDVELRRLPAPPAGRDDYWKMKASRTSPTGLGRIEKSTDSTMPIMGIGGLEQRLEGAADFGRMKQVYEARLNGEVIHSRADRDIYDGEVWAWSTADVNRVAYVDGKGDLFIADADGARARRVMKGDFLLPAWSTDGRAVAVVERNSAKRRWDVYVVTIR